MERTDLENRSNLFHFSTFTFILILWHYTIIIRQITAFVQCDLCNIILVFYFIITFFNDALSCSRVESKLRCILRRRKERAVVKLIIRYERETRRDLSSWDDDDCSGIDRDFAFGWLANESEKSSRYDVPEETRSPKTLCHCAIQHGVAAQQARISVQRIERPEAFQREWK